MNRVMQRMGRGGLMYKLNVWTNARSNSVRPQSNGSYSRWYVWRDLSTSYSSLAPQKTHKCVLHLNRGLCHHDRMGRDKWRWYKSRKEVQCLCLAWQETIQIIRKRDWYSTIHEGRLVNNETKEKEKEKENNGTCCLTWTWVKLDLTKNLTILTKTKLKLDYNWTRNLTKTTPKEYWMNTEDYCWLKTNSKARDWRKKSPRPHLHGVTGFREGHTSDLFGHKETTFCVPITAYCVQIRQFMSEWLHVLPEWLLVTHEWARNCQKNY